MFVLFSKRPLNNGSKGFRFCFKVGYYKNGKENLLINRQGKYIKRATKSRGIGAGMGDCFYQLHLFRRSLYVEHKWNRASARRLHHFAG